MNAPALNEIPFFSLCRQDGDVMALFASAGGLVRIYRAEAPDGTITPYCVWSTVYAKGEDYLAHDPDADQFVISIEIYHDTPELCSEAAQAIISAIQSSCYIEHRGESRDQSSRKYTVRLEADFIENRE